VRWTDNLSICCSIPIILTATDRHGVRSDTWENLIYYPRTGSADLR